MRLALECGLALGLFVVSATLACGNSSGIDLYAGQDASAGRAGSSAGGGVGRGGSGASSVGGSGGGVSGSGGSGASGGNGSFGAGGDTGSGFGGSVGSMGASGAAGVAGTGGSMGTSGSSGVGGTTGADGGVGTGGSSGSATSDGGQNLPGSVVCGTGTCSLASQFCCRYVNGQNPACVPTNGTCAEGTDLICDGPEDCDTGQVCCGRLVNSGEFGRVYNLVSCAMPSSCTGMNDAVVCGSDPTQCQGGNVCAASTVAPWLMICRDPP